MATEAVSGIGGVERVAENRVKEVFLVAGVLAAVGVAVIAMEASGTIDWLEAVQAKLAHAMLLLTERVATASLAELWPKVVSAWRDPQIGEALRGLAQSVYDQVGFIDNLRDVPQNIAGTVREFTQSWGNKGEVYAWQARAPEEWGLGCENVGFLGVNLSPASAEVTVTFKNTVGEIMGHAVELAHQLDPGIDVWNQGFCPTASEGVSRANVEVNFIGDVLRSSLVLE